MIFTKAAAPQCKISDFWLLRWFSPNLYFDRLLLLKVYKVSAKTSMEKICLMIRKSGAKFEENLIFCSKNGKNLRNFDLSTKSLKKECTSIGLFCAKYTAFDLKKYRGFIFHETEKSCKIWRETDLWLGEWQGI